MKLKEIGFFKELSYGRENGPSINDYVSNINIEDEENIINYIKNGKVFIVSPGLVYDIFDKSKIIGGGPYVLTDGTYIWFQELAYYIEQYHINLPHDFIMHMKFNNWEVPQNVDLKVMEYTF